MPFSMRSLCRLPLTYVLGFMSLIMLLVLSSGPAYAEWVSLGDSDSGMTVYVDPDTMIDNGMSGAPVLDTSGDHDVVIGVASSDISLDSSSFAASGEDAFASILWPAMTIKLEQENLGGMNGPTLIDLVKQGLIADRGRAHEHIQVSPETTPEIILMRWV